jgi:hypothetical protein
MFAATHELAPGLVVERLEQTVGEIATVGHRVAKDSAVVGMRQDELAETGRLTLEPGAGALCDMKTGKVLSKRGRSHAHRPAGAERTLFEEARPAGEHGVDLGHDAAHGRGDVRTPLSLYQ